MSKLPEWWQSDKPWIIGDFIDNTIPDNSIDLILTSPPYNANQEYEDELTATEYKSLVSAWVKEMARIVKHRICLNVPFDNEVKGRGGPVPTAFIWQSALEETDLKYQDTIIWNKSNSGNDTAWGSWLSASSPHQRHMAEAILIYYKGEWGIGPGDNNIKAVEFTTWTQNVWSMATAKRDTHPCPFPNELAERCIKLYSHIGAIVLDPFVGSGTTLLECRKNQRLGLAFEIDKTYEIELRKKSLQDIKPLEDYFADVPDVPKKEAPNTPNKRRL